MRWHGTIRVSEASKGGSQNTQKDIQKRIYKKDIQKKMEDRYECSIKGRSGNDYRRRYKVG